jgi:glutathione S-transferase
MHQLYSFRRCPYAIRTRMTLRYTAIKVELREIVLKDKPEVMMQLSPKGTVPVLQLDSQEVLEESRDIIAWALQQADPDNWLYRGQSEQQRDMLALVDENDDDFKTWLDRYKYSDHHPQQSQVYFREQGLSFLTKLNHQLEANTCLFGSATCWADIAIFPFVRQFAFVDKAWFDKQNLAALQTWLDSHLHSELFLSVMGKYVPWKTGDKPVVL